ncbi:ectonucleoside triphosphate diphosphohydrolase 6 (putative function), partial [Reticulomyxa filosa]
KKKIIMTVFFFFPPPLKKKELVPSFGRDYEYAVIIDAGSTGSRVHVYRFSRYPSGMLIDFDFANHQYKKFSPGLSSFEYQTLKRSKITQYLSPLINYAREHVPHYVRSRTPLYLLATAGMRKLREENNTLASMIMRMCAEELQDSEFLVKKDWVRIIDGKHEGVWGWITANYLNGEIQKGVTMGSPFQVLKLRKGTGEGRKKKKGKTENDNKFNNNKK